MSAYELKRYRSMARKTGLPLVLLSKRAPNRSLLTYDDLSFYRRHSCLPWRRIDGMLVVACCRVSTSIQKAIQAHYSEKVVLVYTTPRDLRSTLERLFGEQIEQDARTRILREMPHFSAYYTLTRPQITVLAILAMMIAALIALKPLWLVLASLCLMNVFYTLSIGFKWLLYRHSRDNSQSIDHRSLDEPSLPTYSVLIPMYHEEESVPRLLDAIRALDYPKDKLDVKLVIEADDLKTLHAIIRHKPEAYFDIIRVPPSQPRTKPKACSYALNFARGDYVTIYDAEDRPEPQQLKKAVATFRASPENVICLQGRLNYYNWNENILTRCFAIEYANLFDLMLPGLQKLNIPIPLGGTSNHIHLARLRELKDWDPYNVTEDADLGVRLSMHGYATRMLDSVTMEEAPIGLIAWIKQRTRWIKGYMQTWLVYMRRPALLYRTLGLRAFIGFHLFIGMPCMVFILSPIFWLLSACWAVGMIRHDLADWLIALCLISFALGYLTQVIMARRSAKDWQWQDMQGIIPFYPFYWFLHAFASLRALWQLILRPHYWDKTAHAQTRLKKAAIGLDSIPNARYKPVSI